MVRHAVVATCNLNQWSMDFDLNLRNIFRSIAVAKQRGCTFRTGPELEITGYGCEDHFLEMDTERHAWESIRTLLQSDATDGILCDIGMPVLHRNTRYNCRLFILNRQILLIRPKLHLADDGNYRESRWFTAWTKFYEVDTFPLPEEIRKINGQRSVPFGIAILQLNDSTIASETCEELFTPNSPHIHLALCGAEIIANGSGSHHNLRKLDTRFNLIKNATGKAGGAYLYANQKGCDGGRLYYDGCSSIYSNGALIAQGSQFSVAEVEVVSAVLDLDDIRSYRALIVSRGIQAAAEKTITTIPIDFNLCVSRSSNLAASVPRELTTLSPQEEIAFGPACWLWDYLRRSGAAGYFLPLSGGADSSAVCALVGHMSMLVIKAINAGDQDVLTDARRIAGEGSNYIPNDYREFTNRVLHTCYMGTKNSSEETRSRAKQLAHEVGSYHLEVEIDPIVSAILSVFSSLTGKIPRFKAHGGTPTENLALQNIQARLRMVFAYLSAQLLPWVRSKNGFLLVLGSANVDEALRGYMTKYDCSAADINPIGGISKGDLKSFLLWAADNLGFKVLKDVVSAPPTAELEPITEDYRQEDEIDMGMSYDELGVYGRLRKIYRAGPVTMYEKLVKLWGTTRNLSPLSVAEKVKKFFYFYSINRHKLTTLTPSYHAENYSPEDNRFDLRQFLYNAKWTRQFNTIDALAKDDENNWGVMKSSTTAAADDSKGGVAKL